MREVKLANLAGFCYGVSRAVDLCIETKQQNPKKTVCVLGKLIHNRQAVKYLKENGIKTINSIDEIPRGAICVIRSHGEGPNTLVELETKGIEIVDATCPDVKRVQNTAAQLAIENYQVIIFGQSDHPEVFAIKEHVNAKNKKPAIIISDINEINHYKELITAARKIGTVVQTTKPMKEFTTFLSHISSLCYELRAFNTICNTTSKRQEQAIELAKEVDFMVVIGDKHSSNTTNLAQLCKEINHNTVHVENTRELKKLNLSNYTSIGVTAGASTPKFIIDKVMEYLTCYKGD